MLRIFFFIAIVTIAAAGCASPANTPANNDSLKDVSGAKQLQEKSSEAWQTKWEKIRQEAKREGKVVVYGAATGEIRDALIKGFNNRFGIPVEYMAAKGPEIATKVLAERRAGLYIPDAIIGASVPAITVLKPAGAFDPIEPVLVLPEVLDPKVWWNNELPWVDKDHYFIAFLAYASNNIAVNAEVVKADEIKSYRDLLAPKWKGKLAMHDPTIAGSGRSFTAVMAFYIMGVDFLRQLASQEPFIARDHRLLAEWVARGKYPVGIALESEAIEQMRSAGMRLQYATASEGTYVTTGTGFLSLPKNAPHPNASVLFINWLMSKEGQTTYTDVARLQSARADIPITNVDPFSVRKPGVKYFVTSTEEYQLRGPESIELSKEIFGHLIK